MPTVQKRISRVSLLFAMLAVFACGFVPAVASAATVTVASSADSGPGSLRADVSAAGPGDTIVIPASIPTITLSSSAITVTQAAPGLTIQGAGAGATTVSGGNATSIFSLGTSASLALSGLTVTGGSPGGNNDGGAILGSSGVTLTITNCAFTNNLTGPSSGDGGAIYLFSGSSLTISGSTFTGNGSTGTSGDGGAIHMDSSGTLAITNSTFANNHGGSSSGDGGAIQMNSGAMVSVTGSTFSANHAGPATGWGGAMQINSTSTLTVTNSTIANNTAGGIGGGIEMNSGATATILNATITGNQAIAGGGFDLGGGSASFLNTILAGNVAPSGTNCAGTITDQGHNDENGTSCAFTGAGDLNVDPRLGALQDNGGPTLTEAPQTGSPVIDAGTNSGCPSTDQRGLPRPYGPSCDIGAVELQPPSTTHTLTASVIGSGSIKGSGISCPGTCSMSYPAGSSVPLTATAAAGSKFAGWSGACTGASACTVTMNGDQTVTATFTRSVPPPTCTLTLNSSSVPLSKHKTGKRPMPRVGTLAVTAKCDQAAKATLTGVLTQVAAKKTKHGKQRTHTYSLGPSKISLNAKQALVLTVKLPRAALSALKSGAHESVALTLTATNANGSTTTRARSARLRVASG